MRINVASVFAGLFVIGLIVLSIGASQHNGTFTIIGSALLLGAAVAGFFARKKLAD